MSEIHWSSMPDQPPDPEAPDRLKLLEARITVLEKLIEALLGADLSALWNSNPTTVVNIVVYKNAVEIFFTDEMWPRTLFREKLEKRWQSYDD